MQHVCVCKSDASWALEVKVMAGDEGDSFDRMIAFFQKYNIRWK